MEERELKAAIAALFGCFSEDTLQADWRDTRDSQTLEEFEEWLGNNAGRIRGATREPPSQYDLELLQEAWQRHRSNEAA